MALEAGTRLGTFEVLSPLGAGGMGEVYRAHDTELGREVALKLLPESLADDPERLARLKREARTLAALNHPGIATVHEIGEAEGTSFLVMELVEGPTLAERLKGGALPVDEALELGRQTAAALEAAHEKAIIHRDLKPANIKLTKEGQVKLLDFGLAKVAVGAEVDSEGPTATREGSATGSVMGTAAYMSPEQARGQELDRRTDVWSFGCVLYEMLTGRRAFQADTISDTLAGVLEHEPEWDLLPETTPAPVRTLLRRCLRKDQAKRLHDIADARIEIQETLAEPSAPLPVSTAARARLSGRQAGLWFFGVPFLAAAATGLIVWTVMRPKPAPHVPQRLTISPSQKAPLLGRFSWGKLALSPDGTRLVYLAVAGGRLQLYLRPLGQLEATPIAGTEAVATPFFSPDGQWVGFGQDRKLKKISVHGGTPVTICEIGIRLRAASWGEDDTILFSSAVPGLSRVSANGGTPQPATRPPEGVSHRFPQILPGGESAVFTILPKNPRQLPRLAVLSLKTGETRVVLDEGGTSPRYLPSGHLVYAQYGSLRAVPFDLQRLEVTGEPLEVLEDVSMYMTTNHIAHLDVSRKGSLAYVPGRFAPERSLAWVDRQGNTEPVTEERRAYRRPQLSPDGTRLAVYIETSDGRSDLWVYALRQGAWTRLTFEDSNWYPTWSPDGRRLAFGSIREDGSWELWQVPADGSRAPRRLMAKTGIDYPDAWSPDGRYLVFSRQPSGRPQDLWILPLDGEGEARPYAATPFWESQACFSPDGRWVAYTSNESGRYEIYVLSFPDPGQKWTVSTEGGWDPQWSPDGREIFFRSLNRKQMMVAAVQIGPTFHSEPPRVLFDDKGQIRSYAVAPDGMRFVAEWQEEEEREQIVVIPDFADEVEAKFRAAER